LEKRSKKLLLIRDRGIPGALEGVMNSIRDCKPPMLSLRGGWEGGGQLSGGWHEKQTFASGVRVASAQVS